MSDAPRYPTLGHALAALDALPIAGSMQITQQRMGVDYDALDRARRLLPQVWSDEAVLERIGMTPQGGLVLIWRRGDSSLELTIDPLALFGFRLESPSKLVDWTRATLEHTVADTRAGLGLPALNRPASGGSAAAGAGAAAPMARGGGARA
jgi:hypothetical protein